MMNKFFWKEFSSVKESIISEIVFGNLSLRHKSYIKELIGTAEALLGRNSIDSVILFGSVAHDFVSPMSDIDILIIANNSISSKKIKSVEPILTTIEIKHKFAEYHYDPLSQIIQIVNRNTGMFCSHFICRHQAWEEKNFAKIFSTSSGLTKMLAPNKIVLDSMRAGARVIYGNANIANHQTPISHRQLIKSMLMNLILWSGTILLIPWNQKFMKYFLEAYKWSLKSCSYTLFRYIRPLHTIISNYERIGETGDFVMRFRSLRQNLHIDLGFALSVPYHVIKMHGIAMRYLNDLD
ncbi:nucleotidyltransferase domain-containing protein [Candidatus Lokiarchaeum ossiferum]|uniref:nucleotidyltransferase domain-containing protein n=1 Tax=Candidatus Lokiarchaeum ossiferum TaxID=2951803 RepID=UPI00352F9B8C